MIAPPLRLHDCSLVTDGAAAVVVTATAQVPDRARAAEIAGIGHAEERLPENVRPNMHDLMAGKAAAARAYGEAGITASQIDLVEVHDCFTINMIMSTEALGLADDGRAGYDYLDGRFTRDDRVAMNLSGGLKAKGHPVGATGVSMHAPAVQAADRGAHRRAGAPGRSGGGLQRGRVGGHQLHNQAGAPTAFRDFARDLLADAVAAAGVQGITVRVVGGEEPLHPDQATAVSLVMLECFHNALEHGYADGPGGTIEVALRRDEELWRLTVRDHGRGPPEGLDLERGESLGLKIVRAMAVQLQGEFSISPGAPGAVCRLTYPAQE